MIRGGANWAVAEKVEESFKATFPLDERAEHLIKEHRAGRLPVKVKDGSIVSSPVHIRLARIRSVLRTVLGGLKYKSFKASTAGTTASVLFRKELPDGKVRDFRISLGVSRMSNLGEFGSTRFWAPELIGWAVLESIAKSMRDPASQGLENEVIIIPGSWDRTHEWHHYSHQHTLKVFAREAGFTSQNDVESILLWCLFEEIGFDQEAIKVIKAFQGSIGDKAKSNKKAHEIRSAKVKIRPHIETLLKHGISQEEIIEIMNEVLVESVVKT